MDFAFDTSLYLSLSLSLYGSLSFLCGKIYRTLKYQYYGWFDKPIIKIDVSKYV